MVSVENVFPILKDPSSAVSSIRLGHALLLDLNNQARAYSAGDGAYAFPAHFITDNIEAQISPRDSCVDGRKKKPHPRMHE